MAEKILTPITENFATKFYFGKSVNPYTFHRLFDEFLSEGYDVNISSLNTNYFAKFINRRERKSIELTINYISFFPALETEKEIEEIRKRIFRHVAKRHEVYSRTAKENLELSMSSLLKNDLRTCASLLYYSLHKYTSSIMYQFFNTKLNISDHDIKFEEIEHYTSRMFIKFKDNIEKQEQDPIDEDKIQDLLNHHTTRYKVDPFMLLYHTLDDTKRYSQKLVSYITFLSDNLFSINYYEEGSIEVYNTIYESLMSELENEKNQEKEVKATIAYCLKESISKKENSEIWLLFTVALRLYWLRQTADYEFDFDVKTSVIEMATLVYTIRSMFELSNLITIEENKKSDIHDIENKNKSNDTEDLNEPSEDIKSISCNLYSTDFKFPDELLFEDDDKEIGLYMTVLHLDSKYDIENILYTLNLIPNITYRNKYIIFETSIQSITLPLYLTLDKDGRWIFWFTSERDSINSYSEYDLIEAFTEFFKVLSNHYKYFYNETLIPNIIGSKPRHYSSAISMIKTQDLLKYQLEIQKRKDKILEEISIYLRRTINSIPMNSIRNSTLILFNLNININLFFDLKELNINIPINDYYRKENNEQFMTLQLNIIISDNPYLLNHPHAVDNTYNDFKENNNIDWFKTNNIVISPNSLDKIIKEKDISLLNEIITRINQLCYEDIEKNINHLESKNILELLTNSKTTNSLPFATLGYWYLIKGPIEEAEEKGKQYYEKAIEIEKEYKYYSDLDTGFLDQLEQKYNLELARFYGKRQNNKEKAIDFIMHGIEKHVRFQGKFEKLIEELEIDILDDVTTNQVALSKIPLEKNADEINDGNNGDGDVNQINDGNNDGKNDGGDVNQINDGNNDGNNDDGDVNQINDGNNDDGDVNQINEK